VHYAAWQFSTNSSLLINDGLMPLFFLLVGLEIKREICIGELNSAKKIALPGLAALGGILVPALIFMAFTYPNADLTRGWAIPTATDIAFALGALKLLGKKIPFSLQIFLMALAIFDDLAAIIIIAFFYTQQLHLIYLSWAALLLGGLLLLNRLRYERILLYLVLGAGLAFTIFKAGIHPTIAGVLLAFTLPLTVENKVSPLARLEKGLHPWVSFLILPLFAFASTGVKLHALSPATLGVITLGISLGLLFGKPLGILLACWLSVKARLAVLTKELNWPLLLGAALLCGIGFTMSLFIAELAFATQDFLNSARFGILLGSVFSGMLGYGWLKICTRKARVSSK